MGRFRGASVSGWVRPVWIVTAFAIAVACDLNPQPEVPGADTGGSKSLGGAGGVHSGGGGSGGSGGSGALQGSGGQPPSGGGAGGTQSGLACNGTCTGSQVCFSGSCVDDPCAPNSCNADQACKPNADYTAGNCTGSCAGVTCAQNETCVSGQCVSYGCASECQTGEACQLSADAGYACGPNLCSLDGGVACAAGEICDPANGSCVPEPCNAVKCPTNQSCIAGECEWANDGGATTDASSD